MTSPDESAVESLYQRLAAGRAVPSIPGSARHSLAQRARDGLDGTRDEREAALRVGAALRGYEGGDLLREAVRLGGADLARRALYWAERSTPDGLLALRAALEHDDRQVVLGALDVFERHADPSGTSRARALLRHDEAAVRAAAARYLGRVAGVAVVPMLQSLLQDEAVRDEARLAIDRIERREPRPEPEPWPEPGQEAEPLQVPPEERPPADLSEMPDDLLRHLGRTGERDRQRLLEALEAADDSRLAATIRGLDFHSPADLAVGAVRLTRWKQDRRWVLPVRRLLRHPEAWVRWEAVQTARVVGGDADREVLEDMRDDPVPEVREAVRAALHEVGEDPPRLEGPAGEG